MSHRNFSNANAGSGADGALTVTSGTTTLTRDMNYTTVTIQTGTRLDTAGYRLFARKIIIQGTGKLSADGNPGGVVNMWDYAAAITASTISLGCYISSGGTNNGPAGPNGGTTSNGTVLANGAGGAGGGGGAGGNSGTGGTGGATTTGGTIASAEYFSRHTLDFLRLGTGIRGGGAGGGGGGGADTGAYTGGTSGGSGGGGNVLAFWCEELDISTAGAGAISAKGGAPKASTTGYSANAGGAGGGGGGGGGYIHAEIGFVTGTVSGVANADGTAGADGMAGGASGKGGQGGAGGAGGNIDIYVYATNTWYTARGSAGGARPTAPTTSAGSTGGAAGTCSVTL